MKRSKSHIFVSFFSLLFFLPTLSANKLKLPKIDFSKEIVFGQSAFLSEGALQLYGELIRNAINARFNRINENGGITGTASRGDKILKLVSLDDAGEPEKTLRNINFFKKHNIDMFLGNTGTRSTLKILPMIQKKEIALFFPWGGDDRLRKPDLTNLVNGLGLIRPQLKTMVNHTIDTLGLKKIAIFQHYH
jgi:ABC-type branched-subunit amino acid transport system substrate-binding protein